MLTKKDITETFGREVDEIEDIRICLERSYTTVYDDPENGDFISDDYRDIIDLTTQPGNLNEHEANNLNRAIRHLNDVYPAIEASLGQVDLLDTYLGVVKQLNAINVPDVQVDEIATGVLLPLPSGVIEIY